MTGYPINPSVREAPDPEQLTIHDNLQSNESYDAFLLYANADEEFALQAKFNLENYDYKICDKFDLIAGVVELDAVVKLISKRCNKVIVLISPEFIDSQQNIFLTLFSQCHGFDERRRIIIPCVIKTIDRSLMPETLRVLHQLYYGGLRINYFWERLRASIGEPFGAIPR